MTLTSVTLTMRPWPGRSHGLTSVLIEVRSDKLSFTCEHYLPHNSFKSEFDQVWEEMKFELDKLIDATSKEENAK